MKTRLLFAFLVLTFTVSAQSLVLSYEGDTLAPNEEITVSGSPWGTEIVVEMDVTNTSSNNINVLIQRYENSMLPGTSSGICWGLCYPPYVGLTPTSLTINAGDTNDSDFSGHYYPSNAIGMSTISYVFFDENNVNDSTMVVVHFDGVVTGTNDIPALVARAYPNPANEKLSISLEQSNTTKQQVELLSITGQLIEAVTVSAGKASFNTSNLENGIYFYRVLENGRTIFSDRAIVQH